MTTAITKELLCIKMRNGVEIWTEKEKAQRLIDLLGTTETKFVEIGDEMINSASIDGVFTPQTMEELTRRKNGQWKDEKGIWRNRGDYACPTCKNIIPFGMKCGNCGR